MTDLELLPSEGSWPLPVRIFQATLLLDSGIVPMLLEYPA